MEKENYLQRYATGARTALAVMREELAEVSGDAEKALSIIDRVIVEAEAGRHPLLQSEETARVRWPLRPHWDCWSSALLQLADACGTQVDCAQKWNRMRVTASAGRTVNLTMALAEVGDFIEVASEMDSNEIREALRTQVPVHLSAGHSPYIVLADIPNAWRSEFSKFLYGSGAPIVEGAGPCAWPVDWVRWLDADWREGWRRELSLTVRDLLGALRGLSPDLPVMLPAEGGIDYALHVRVAEVAIHRRNWQGTPVGRYVELPDSNKTGQPFKALLLAFDPPSDMTWLERGR